MQMNKLRSREGRALSKVMQQVCEGQCQKPGVPAPRSGLGGPEQQGLLIQTSFYSFTDYCWNSPGR